MNKMHDYTVKGHPKVKIIFMLSVVSATVAPQLTKALDYLFNQKLHLGFTFAISISIVFGVFYFIFSKWLWKTKLFGRIFKFPNLNGKYEIDGLSLKNPTGEKINWNGILSIEQDWDKILIVLKTSTSSSSSNSVQGCVEYIPQNGYKLSYNYTNRPDISEEELRTHDGNCVIEFTDDILTARANYYNNGKERSSYGTMELRRVTNG